MNLYFRLFYILLFKVKKLSYRIGLLDEGSISFRALPSDCDINFHLNNSRYLAMMDLARTWLMAEMGLLHLFIKDKWMPIMNACSITYIREIKPFQKFDIKTKMIGWDEKYYYIEQRFESENILHAVAYVRGVFIHKGRRIENDELLKVAKFEGAAPELPEPVIHWKMLLDAKKKHHS